MSEKRSEYDRVIYDLNNASIKSVLFHSKESAELHTVPLSDLIELMDKFFYSEYEIDTNGWQVDFWLTFSSKVVELPNKYIISGSLFYGDYSISPVDKVDLETYVIPSDAENDVMPGIPGLYDVDVTPSIEGVAELIASTRKFLDDLRGERLSSETWEYDYSPLVEGDYFKAGDIYPIENALVPYHEDNDVNMETKYALAHTFYIPEIVRKIKRIVL